MANILGSAVTVERVEDAAALSRFIRLQHALMRDDPAFVPPLLMERRDALSPRSNPWFRHGEAAFWIARRGGRDVGRISAQQDHSARDPDGAQPAHFGLLAAIDDAAVFAALLGTAEAWARGRGLPRIRGPFSLSINEQAGLLVQGAETPPMLMMPHDPPHAAAHLEALGYAKARDLLAYVADTDGALPEAAARIVARGLPAGITLRPLRRARLAEEIAALIGIFNAAWAGNWGFVPFTPEEVAHLAREMKPLLDERLVWFAEAEGQPIAFAVCLPNLNEAICDLNGRLLPFGWARLLWRLKIRGVTTARVPLMGVRPDAARGLFGRVLPLFLVEALRREAKALGIQRIEMSWVLEDNLPMRRLAEALGAAPYKTYRVYEKGLGGMIAGVTALVLAGQRPGAPDPMAVAAGVSHKALLPVGGVPMLLRVVAALQACPGIARIVVAIEAPEVTLAGIAGLDGVLLRPAAAGPAASAGRAFAEFGAPLLVTTADHALLTPAMVAHLLSGAPTGAAASVAVARRETVMAAFPDTRRTWLRFRDGAFSGCNLFLLSGPAARGAVEVWQRVEALRKRPLAMIGLLGPWTLLRFVLGVLDTKAALGAFGRRAGTTVALVELPFGEAAVDVDKPDDLALAEAALRAR